MNETYSEEFVKSLKRFSSIKKSIVNKIDKIIQDPLMGEPLKYDLRGLYSAPVAKFFLLYTATVKPVGKKATIKSCSVTIALI